MTVRNDRQGLVELRGALERQTRMPDEIVVVDGGSTDGSLEELERWEIPGVPVRVAVEAGANISAGRNAAVRLASHDWLLCTDAGCRPEAGWVESLIRARERADVAVGVFLVDGETPFERAVACTYYPWPAEPGGDSAVVRASYRLFGRRFDAAATNGRSLGFSREAWRAAGGFPESIYATEDIAFGRAAVKAGYQPELITDAIVRWRPRPTWRANALMFFVYARGDVRTPGRGRHLLRAGAWGIGLPTAVRAGWPSRAALVFGALAYSWLPLRRARIAGIDAQAWWRVPFLIGLKDISQLAGAAAGAIDAARGAPQPQPR